MNPIAIYSGSTVLYWSSVIIVFGLLASLVLSLSLQRVNGGSSAAMLLFFPLAIILSVPICRVIHWYCHFEQYNGIWGALTDYSTGSYCLPGALLGAWLAALIVKKLGFERSTAHLLDAFAPGAALAVAFIRLSALFNSSCRSKIAVTTPALQHLPTLPASRIPQAPLNTASRPSLWSFCLCSSRRQSCLSSSIAAANVR